MKPISAIFCTVAMFCGAVSASARVLPEESEILPAITMPSNVLPSIETGMIQDRTFIINSFIINNVKKFFPSDLDYIANELKEADDATLLCLTGQNYLDPTAMLVISVVAGGLGVDRFILGDTGLGVLKLITAGGLGIWWLVDLFRVQDMSKYRNYDLFMEAQNVSSLLYN